ncbi:MAG: ABC transporter ATP-binding protein, partial [Anaerolineae bacterium]
LALARAIIKNPPILILDDATSSVDLETESAIRAALEALTDRSNGRQRTTFVIAHRVQSVMNADRILVLDKGRIVQQGKHEELIAQEGPYQRIFAIQAMIEEELEQDLASALAGTEEAA